MMGSFTQWNSLFRPVEQNSFMLMEQIIPISGTIYSYM